MGAVFGFQKVDLNPRFTLLIENPEVRDRLVVSGLNVDGKQLHVTFFCHKRRERPRVYIPQLPIGISDLDISEVFAFYGNILEFQYIAKMLYGRKIDTGDN